MNKLFENIKKNYTQYISIVSSIGSQIWTWTKRVLIYSSRYAGNALAVGAVGASVVSLGSSLDSSTQLKNVQIAVSSQQAALQQTIEQANSAKSSLDNAIPSLTATLDETKKAQAETVKKLEDVKNDSVKAIDDLQSHLGTNTQKQAELESNITQSNQTLQNISQKTIKAEADLKEVFGKIDDANITLNSLTDKSQKIVDDLKNASGDLIAKNTQQDTSLRDNLKAIDTSFQGLYSSVSSIDTFAKSLDTRETTTDSDFKSLNILHNALRSDFDALVVDYNSKIIALQNSISTLQNANTTQSGSNTTTNSRLDTLDSGVATLVSRVDTHQINIDVAFANEDSTRGRVEHIEQAALGLHFPIGSGSGTQSNYLTYTPNELPVVVCSVNDDTGYVEVSNITMTTFDYTVIGSALVGNVSCIVINSLYG